MVRFGCICKLLTFSLWRFCSGKPTVQALLTDKSDWLEMMESGIETAAVFFKAFDSVTHKVFTKKNCKPLAWMSTFCKRSLSTLPNICRMTRPQNFSVLLAVCNSSLSWGSFITLMQLVSYQMLSPGSKAVMYADDIILLYRPSRQASDYQLLQQDVEALGKGLTIIIHLTSNPSNPNPWYSQQRDILSNPLLSLIDLG